jgi:hypothetical protein
VGFQDAMGIGKTKWAIRLSICGFKWSHIALGLTHSSMKTRVYDSAELLSHCVLETHLKPHMDNLIAHFVFPILCQSDEDIELFEDDPSESHIC